MNTNQQLEIQAYVDGQLAVADARRVERQMAEDPAGAALAAELRLVRDTVRDGEPVMAVPETREFYFSQIQRRIAAEEKAASRTSAPAAGSPLQWLRRLFLPVAGVAAVAVVSMFSLRTGPYIPGEMVIASEEMGAITFRSEQNQLTVVYLFDKSSANSIDATSEAPLD
jgi:anti-sigma factor RsiW